MKYLSILILALCFISCNKKCNDILDTRCEEAPPSGVTCQAYFESWIYNQSTGKCEFQGYSGCGAVGFDTKEECEQCECNN